MSEGGQRLATWLLARCASDYRRDSFIGDLIEQYEVRGAWWYWRQTLGAVCAYTLRAFSTAMETHVPAAEFIGDLTLSIALGIFGLMQLPVYAGLLIAGTPLFRLELSLFVVSATICAALIRAATIGHEIKRRSARACFCGQRFAGHGSS